MDDQPALHKKGKVLVYISNKDHILYLAPPIPGGLQVEPHYPLDSR
jgi:hypothetical protein